MPLNNQSETDFRALLDARAQYERTINQQLNEEIRNYRKAFKSFSGLAKNETPRTVLAEGDSWFNYPIGKSISFHIRTSPRFALLNLAKFGDETGDMLSDKQKKRLIKALDWGPGPNQSYDAFIFSGGGNDMLGYGRFRHWIKKYETGMKPEDVVNHTNLKVIFNYLEVKYRELIELRDEYSPTTRIYFNAYDFAQPTGKKACGLGPWLRPALVENEVPELLRAAVVQEVLMAYHQRIKRLENQIENLAVVNTQGTINPNEWANEIHPNNLGFKKIARKFITALEADFPKDD